MFRCIVYLKVQIFTFVSEVKYRLINKYCCPSGMIHFLSLLFFNNIRNYFANVESFADMILDLEVPTLFHET